MRIYVTGCGGMLGDALYKHFSQNHTVMATDIQFTSDWVEYMDVRFYHDMLQDVLEFNPDVIMNLAAMTDLEECENYAQRAIDTNTGGSANCAMVATKLKIPYVYISTAGIFDGQKDFYSDGDQPNPLCMYGKTKYWGELIAQAIPQHLVLRCGWQMGSGPKDKKFIQKIWQQIKSGTTEFNVVGDRFGTPSYVKDCSLQIDKLLETKTFGTFNMVCKGSASRYDMTVELVKLLGLEDKVKINKVTSAFWAKEYYAPRPASERLVTDRLDALDLNVMGAWQDALADYVKEYAEYFKL